MIGLNDGNKEKLFAFFNRIAGIKPGELRCPGGLIHLHTLLEMDVYDERGVFQKHQEVRDRVIPNSFVNLLVDRMQSTSTDAQKQIWNFKYHYSGTGTDVESATDTGLTAGTTETGYVLGSQTESTDGENYYKTVATITYTTTSTGLVISEHMLFNATSSTSGIAMDRSLVSPQITVRNGWSIQFTFSASFTAGG